MSSLVVAGPSLSQPVFPATNKRWSACPLGLMSLPSEIRLLLWWLCVPDDLDIEACLCFDENEHVTQRHCHYGNECQVVDNGDIIIPTPPLLLVNRQIFRESNLFMRQRAKLVFCRYVCIVMFLYHSTNRQRGLISGIRLVKHRDRPFEPLSRTPLSVRFSHALLPEDLENAATRFYGTVNVAARIANSAHVEAEVEVGDVKREPSGHPRDASNSNTS